MFEYTNVISKAPILELLRHFLLEEIIVKPRMQFLMEVHLALRCNHEKIALN